jgi:hypothetical protein
VKIIKTIGRLEFVVEDDEAENIVKAFGTQTLVRLRSGAYLNPSTIAAVIDPPKIPYWGGYKINEDGKSFFRDGKRVYLEPENYQEIKYLEDPKYLNFKMLENAK